MAADGEEEGLMAYGPRGGQRPPQPRRRKPERVCVCTICRLIVEALEFLSLRKPIVVCFKGPTRLSTEVKGRVSTFCAVTSSFSDQLISVVNHIL